jgi:hypothetical protein
VESIPLLPGGKYGNVKYRRVPIIELIQKVSTSAIHHKAAITSRIIPAAQSGGLWKGARSLEESVRRGAEAYAKKNYINTSRRG